MKIKIIISLIFLWNISQLSSAQTASISGRVQLENEEPIPNVMVNLTSENFTTFTLTNKEGQYQFGELSTGVEYIIQMEKEGEVLNGVTTLDMVFTLQHIITLRPFISIYQTLAADVNGNGRVSVSDVILIQNVILGQRTAFEIPAWQFVLTDSNTTDLNGLLFTKTILLNSDENNINFIGVKSGDVNGSAVVN